MTDLLSAVMPALGVLLLVALAALAIVLRVVARPADTRPSIDDKAGDDYESWKTRHS